MTDITNQDRRVAHEWAASIDPEMDCWSASARAVARVILATVDAPPRTLAEDLSNMAEDWETWTTDTITGALTAATDRAKQVENDRDAARDEVERVRAIVDPKGAGLPPGMTISEAVQTLVDGIPTGEHEGLTAEQWKREYDRTHAEVERLTAVNENLRRTDNYRECKEFLGVQKGAESNAETTDPADAKPGEAWVVEVNGDRRTAVKDRGGVEPWCTFNAGGWFLDEDSSDVTLITRLVPAPRVIAKPEDLDRLPHNSVILSADNDAWQKSTRTILWSSPWWDASHGGPAMWASDRLCDEDHPATVLWEPEA